MLKIFNFPMRYMENFPSRHDGFKQLQPPSEQIELGLKIKFPDKVKINLNTNTTRSSIIAIIFTTVLLIFA
jgi:hypothetical protein